MENLIYYPFFEPPNQSWLKFALLYFDRFEPIIPPNRAYALSNEYRRIIDETDLIEAVSPEYSQGDRASLRAIEEAEKILSHPYRFSPSFNRANLRRSWENPDTWNFHIYQEKFTHRLIDFCEQNDIGRWDGEGLLLPEELAFIFMTHLAKEIAFDRDASIITDDIKFDQYTNYNRAISTATRTRNRFAKGIINMMVPVNLNEIDFQTLIEFRNRNREQISAFNRQLRNIQEEIGNGMNQSDFINSFNTIYSDFAREVLTVGVGIASIPLAAYILLANPNATTPEYLKETLGAVGIGLAGVYSLSRVLKDNREQRYCKKYLANLQRIR